MNDDNSKLEQRIQAHLNARSTALDAEMCAKLTQARNKALAQPTKTAIWQRWLQPDYMPALAAGFCAVLVVSALLLRPDGLQDNNKADNLTLAELVSEPEDLDAVTDLGFYAWLDEIETQSEVNDAV